MEAASVFVIWICGFVASEEFGFAYGTGVCAARSEPGLQARGSEDVGAGKTERLVDAGVLELGVRKFVKEIECAEGVVLGFVFEFERGRGIFQLADVAAGIVFGDGGAGKALDVCGEEFFEGRECPFG